MNSKKYWLEIFGVFAGSLIFIWVTFSLYSLYFGNRLPYCGRSINLDKWNTPWVEWVSLPLIVSGLFLGLYLSIRGRPAKNILGIFFVVILGVVVGILVFLTTAEAKCDLGSSAKNLANFAPGPGEVNVYVD